MYRLRRLFLPALLLSISSLVASAQTTLFNETYNNTSACSSPSGNCAGAFTGMSSSSSGVFNAAPGNVSRADLHEMEYSGASTALYVHFMPWFCMQPGSTATGPGTSCNSHIQVGYNSNDPATVRAQMNDMSARGFRGPIIDWYGPKKTIAEQTSQLVRQELESRCSGGVCDMQFALTEDQGSLACPQNGGGTDQTNCVLAALDSDFDYMNVNYFPSPAYLRIDGNTMKPSVQGRPVVFFFVCESCYANPTPNWSYIFGQLRAHVMSYTSGDPLIWFVFRNSGGFSHVESDGGFAWVNHYGSNDPYGLVYLDNFYDVSLKYPTKQTWGAAWKGYDNSLAPWKPALSLTPQQCGNTWVQTWAEMTHNGDYSSSRQLPFLQVVTWNDYEEGTEIETGIDNCMSLSASSDGTNLSWKTSYSAGTGSNATVHHYEVFDSTDGQTLTNVATVPVGTNAVPLSSMNLSTTAAHTMYVKAVGQGSILNKMSNAVTISNTPVVTVTGVSPNSGTTTGGTAVTITGTNFQSGATVAIDGVAAAVSSVTSTSISATTPAHTAGTVSLTVTNPDGTSATLSSAFTYVTPVQPSFTLTSSPTSKTVSRGTTATYSITLSPKNGFTGIVNFAVSGLPSGAVASFSPTSLTNSGTTKLSVKTSKSARGTFTLTVKGTSAISSTVQAGLTVK
jgi:hypothetical protein